MTGRGSSFERGMGRVARLALAALLTGSSACAADLSSVTIHAVVEGSHLGHRNRSDVAAEMIRIKGDRLRVDFDAGEGRRGRVLRDRSGHAWLLMSTSHRALPADHLPIAAMTRLDPERPCWSRDLSCAKVEDREISGRRAHGWRYRHAQQGGPGGTDSGVFWVDAETGLVLSYRGSDLSGKAQRMETTSIDFATLPDDVFAFPESVRTQVEQAGSRASRLRNGG